MYAIIATAHMESDFSYMLSIDFKCFKYYMKLGCLKLGAKL
jgi:hypothetical protein